MSKISRITAHNNTGLAGLGPDIRTVGFSETDGERADPKNTVASNI